MWYERYKNRNEVEMMKQLTYRQILQRLSELPQRTIAQVDKDPMGNTVINFRDGMLNRRVR